MAEPVGPAPSKPVDGSGPQYKAVDLIEVKVRGFPSGPRAGSIHAHTRGRIYERNRNTVVQKFPKGLALGSGPYMNPRDPRFSTEGQGPIFDGSIDGGTP
jgi:hypothetical protein